jgi:hypothetical protein
MPYLEVAEIVGGSEDAARRAAADGHRHLAKDVPERRVPVMNERDLFATLPPIDEAVSWRLHQRLVDAANAAGLLDVAYRTIETPVGTLLLAATAKGLVPGRIRERGP